MLLAVISAAACARADSVATQCLWRPQERWIGVNLPYCLYHLEVRKDSSYNEEDFRYASELGFNFIRLPLDYRCWIKDGDWNQIDDDALAPLDQALEWGRRYGLHVQFCFHRAPGFSVNRWPAEKRNLFLDEAMQEVCCRHWAYFARRWKGVPNERLSFNLLNEPPDVPELPSVSRKLIQAIRAVDLDRFIVLDGADCSRQPISEMVGVDDCVGQSTRGYYPMSVSHCGVPWAGTIVKNAVPRWPINGFATPRYGSGKSNWRTPLRIRNAPAGEWEVGIGYVSSRNQLTISADGRTVMDVVLEPMTNHADWVDATYEKHWDLIVGRAKNPSRFALEKNANELVLDVAEGDWVDIRYVSVKSGERTTQMISDYWWGRRPDEAPFVFQGWNEVPGFIPQEGVLSGQDWLERNVFSKWVEMSKRGGFVMVGECGAAGHTPYDVYLRWMEDQLKLWKKHGFGFAFWTLRGAFGVIDSGREGARTEDFHGHRLDRGMMDLINKYR